MKKQSKNWDYSKLAKNYDKRADYSEALLKNVIKKHKIRNNEMTLDIGAGTGKLTKLLFKFKLNILAIEPNQAMLKIGKKNVPKIKWIKKNAESTKIKKGTIDNIFFGSSFNVINFKKTVRELKRILKVNGKVICIWNHRILNDKHQKQIEKIIFRFLPNYQYGFRREDIRPLLRKSKSFVNIKKYEKKFYIDMKIKDIILAWKSHATLKRQAKNVFNDIIVEISNYLVNLKKNRIKVPYKTVLYYSEIKK